MIRLLYISQAHAEITRPELDSILLDSNNNNLERHISGLLVYCQKYFIQILEGEAETAMTLYEKIKTDPRHQRVRLISKKAIRERHFGHWSMAFKVIPESAAHDYQVLCQLVTDFFRHSNTADIDEKIVAELLKFKAELAQT